MSPAPITLMNCLFFETQAEEAARHYVSIFPNSSIDQITHFTKAGQEYHRQTPGTVLSVAFTLNSMKWLALNARPAGMATNEVISFQIICEGQDDIDHYFDGLTQGISEEDKAKQMCGWLRDRFGVSWQVVPRVMVEAMSGGHEGKIAATMKAFMKSGRIVVSDVEAAIAGVEEE